VDFTIAPGRRDINTAKIHKINGMKWLCRFGLQLSRNSTPSSVKCIQCWSSGAGIDVHTHNTSRHPDFQGCFHSTYRRSSRLDSVTLFLICFALVKKRHYRQKQQPRGTYESSYNAPPLHPASNIILSIFPYSFLPVVTVVVPGPMVQVFPPLGPVFPPFGAVFPPG